VSSSERTWIHTPFCDGIAWIHHVPSSVWVMKVQAKPFGPQDDGTPAPGYAPFRPPWRFARLREADVALVKPCPALPEQVHEFSQQFDARSLVVAAAVVQRVVVISRIRS